MIYRDVDLKAWAEKHHIELKTEKCRWGCEENMIPKPVETKESWGIKYECEKCKCFTYIGRLKDQEFWDKIV